VKQIGSNAQRNYWFIKTKIMKDKKLMTKKSALFHGLFFGVLMLVLTIFINPMFEKEEISFDTLHVQIPVWILAGLAYGFVNRYFYNRNLNKD